MSLKGKRIHVVEDNARNLAIISTVLRQTGALISHDTWGGRTLERLQHYPTDLILMDLMLPGSLTGYDVFDQLKTIPELATIPVVIVSASDPSREMPKARAKGFSGYISKPINHLTFPRILETIINGEAVWGGDDF